MATKKIDPSQNTLPNQPLIACFSFVLITCQKRLFHPSFSFRKGLPVVSMKQFPHMTVRYDSKFETNKPFKVLSDGQRGKQVVEN